MFSPATRLTVFADLRTDLTSQGITATLPGDSDYLSANQACELMAFRGLTMTSLTEQNSQPVVHHPTCRYYFPQQSSRLMPRRNCCVPNICAKQYSSAVRTRDQPRPAFRSRHGMLFAGWRMISTQKPASWRLVPFACSITKESTCHPRTRNSS